MPKKKIEKDYNMIYKNKLIKEGWVYVTTPHDPKPNQLFLPRWELEGSPITIKMCLGFLEVYCKGYDRNKPISFKMSECSSYTIEEHVEAAINQIFDESL